MDFRPYETFFNPSITQSTKLHTHTTYTHSPSTSVNTCSILPTPNPVLFNPQLKMCIQATQYYNRCDCKTIRNVICMRHVDHTRKQLDTAPCPVLELRAAETLEGGCNKREQCKTETSWTFEHWSDWRNIEGSTMFCEKRRRGDHTCDDGRWWPGRSHTCGMGAGVFKWWCHREVKPACVVRGLGKSGFANY